MRLSLPLANNRLATFVSIYSQIDSSDSSNDVKDRLYDTLISTLGRISQDDKIILLGDFNATVGRNHDIWHGVIGHHGVGNVNSSGLRLLSLSLLWIGSRHHKHQLPTPWHAQDFLDVSQVLALALHWLRHCLAQWFEWSANYSSHA